MQFALHLAFMGIFIAYAFTVRVPTEDVDGRCGQAHARSRMCMHAGATTMHTRMREIARDRATKAGHLHACLHAAWAG